MAYTEAEKKNNIKEVQQYLRTVAQANENIPIVVPSGVYDEQTAQAVKMFQKEYRLPVTGKVDKDTWDMLFEAYLAVQEYYEETAAIMPFPNSRYEMSSGMTGYNVYILQAMLDTVADFYSNLDKISIDGIYGEETGGMVKNIQHITGCDSTGCVDYKTWNKLARLYNYHAMLAEEG